VGSGGFGVVSRAESVEDGRPIAVKDLIVVNSDTVIVRFTYAIRILREVGCLMFLDHPTIVRICGWNIGRSVSRLSTIDAMIVMEWFDGGDLFAAIPTLELFERILIAYGIARGMEYAGLKGISHRDLKPANILLDDRKYPHIADFGTGKRDLETWQSDRVGTPGYRPADNPQDLSGVSRDLYAYGCMTYEILIGTHRRPDQTAQFQDGYDEIRHKFAPVLRQDLDICDIVKSSIDDYRNPTRSFSDIVETWNSIIDCLDERIQGPILEYKAMLDAFEPQPRDDSAELEEFLNQLSLCEEVGGRLERGPTLTTQLQCVAAVIEYTAKDDGCDNLELLDRLWACWDAKGRLDLTMLMSSDTRVRAEPDDGLRSRRGSLLLVSSPRNPDVSWEDF
jgi:serine/threonine protein kinase